MIIVSIKRTKMMCSLLMISSVTQKMETIFVGMLELNFERVLIIMKMKIGPRTVQRKRATTCQHIFDEYKGYTTSANLSTA